MHATFIKLAKYNQLMNVAGHSNGRLPAGIYENIQDKISEHRFEIHTDFAALRQDRTSVDTKLLTWVNEGLTEDRLQQVLHYRNARNEEMSRTFNDVLTHLFNHQTHHRGQVTTLLSQQGIDVGVTDFIAHSANW